MEKRNRIIWLGVLAAGMLVLVGCQDDNSADSDTTSDTDTDTDSDTDSDSDTDTDTVSDTDSDTDTSTDSGAEPDPCSGSAVVSQVMSDENGPGAPSEEVRFAQSFVPTVDTLEKVEVYVQEVGDELGPLVVELREDDGGQPSQTVVASGEVDPPQHDPQYFFIFQPYCADLGSVEVDPEGLYWVVLLPSSSPPPSDDALTFWTVGFENPYESGTAMMGVQEDGGFVWSDLDPNGESAVDFVFQVF